MLCAARGQGHANRSNGQWVAIRIGIICQWVEGHWRVECGVVRVIACDRWRVGAAER
ncbi:hypothetical protein NK318_11065 [Acinetobacter junii]